MIYFIYLFFLLYLLLLVYCTSSFFSFWLGEEGEYERNCTECFFFLLTVVAFMWLDWRQKRHENSNKRMHKNVLMEVSISKSHSLVLENMLKYS